MRRTRVKQLFLDLETTGTDPQAHGVWQIAGHIVIDDEEKERFNLLCQPFPGQMVSQEAMVATGTSVEALRKLPAAKDAFTVLLRTLAKYVGKYDRYDKLTVIGYNARFDTDFLRKWFENNGDSYYGSWFWHPPVDVMNLAMFHLHRCRGGLRLSGSLEDFKQSSVASYLGVEFDGPAHDADNDVGVTRKLYQHFVDKGLNVLMGLSA